MIFIRAAHQVSEHPNQGVSVLPGKFWMLRPSLNSGSVPKDVAYWNDSQCCHRLLPSALRGSGSEGRASAAELQQFQLETDTQVMRQFWRCLWGLTVKQPNESRSRASSNWSHVAKVTRQSFLVLLLIERVWEKKWMRLWSDALFSLLRIRSDLEDSSLLLSKYPTLCGSVGDAPRCRKMSFMIVELFLSTFSEILAALFIFFWHATEEYFQHLSNKKNLNVLLRVRNAEIYGCTWQLCTISIPPL